MSAATTTRGISPATDPSQPNPGSVRVQPVYDQASRLRQMVASFNQGVVSSLGASSLPALAGAPTPLRLRKVPIIAITSGKGGVGKTSLAVNLSALLARRHLRVTLLDADLGLANADVLCGVTPSRRLESVLTMGEGRRSMAQIAVDAPGGFKLVPGSAGVGRMANLPPTERAALLDALLELEDTNDLIIIDTGAGLSESVLAFVRYADIAAVVVTPEPTSMADAYATIKMIARGPKPPQLHQAQVPTTRLGVLVNQAADEPEAMQVFERLRSTAARFLQVEPILLGWVRKDSAIPTSIRARGPVAVHTPDAPVVQDLRTVSEHLAKLSGIRLVEQAMPEPKGWWAKLFSK